MYKILLTFTALCFTLSTQAQNYQFAYSTGTYTEISGGTALFKGTGAYNDSVALPFNFTMDGVTNKKVQVTLTGEITTGPYSIKSYWFWAMEGAEIFNGICSYTITGNTGDHIAKIQFKDNQFSHEWGNGNQSRCNFQVWLYEKDSAIEVHYGPSNIVDLADCYQGAPGPAIGLPGLFAQGSANAPSSGSQAVYLNGTPPNGAIYRFGPPASSGTGVQQIISTANSIVLYPIPAYEQLYIKSTHPTSFDIYDMTGRKVISLNDRPANTAIDISGFSKGMYVLKTAEGVALPFSKN